MTRTARARTADDKRCALVKTIDLQVTNRSRPKANAGHEDFTLL
jgi:hypothetical protein